MKRLDRPRMQRQAEVPTSNLQAALSGETYCRFLSLTISAIKNHAVSKTFSGIHLQSIIMISTGRFNSVLYNNTIDHTSQ